MKEVRDYYEQFDTCREHDIPMCADACPFRLDILDVQERIAKKRFNAAYKSIRDCVAFPGIVAEICPAYCQDACIRKAFDEPLQIRELERAVNHLASRRDPNSYNLPARSERVAVIGGGISGMAFALKMSSRKCDVTVYEKSNCIGGTLAQFMSPEAYMAEFELQFKYEKYNLLLNTEFKQDDFAKYDLVYIATGKNGSRFGIETECGRIGDTAVFLGGELLGKDLMHALADGINIATSADAFLKTGVLDYPQAPAASRCVANEDLLVETPAVHIGGVGDATGTDADTYSEEECVAEAERCIRCQCDACESYCDLIDYYEKWPIKMRDEIFLSVKPAGSLVHKCPSRKYIAACTECRMLKDTCPENIDLCGMIKSARHQMHQVDKMPAAYRQYYLRDMEFANGKYAALAKRGVSDSNHEGTPDYAFFPGCNLGVLDPDYVIKPYEWLTDNYPGTGLLLRCCSVPIDWAGNAEAHVLALEQLKADWEFLGKPVLVTACLSCDKHLHEYLPEIETITLYELMGQGDVYPVPPEIAKVGQGTRPPVPYSVFDPCSARGNNTVQQAVRRLAEVAGITVEDLPKGDMHGCCGFGGQGGIAQPEFAEYVARKKAELSDNPYLVYCSNCRDVFSAQDKPAVHILDLLFDIDPKCERPTPGLTERRVNRVLLKDRLLREFWGEEMIDKPEKLKYNLEITDDAEAKIQAQHIIADDIVNVIERAERTGRRTKNPANGHYKAYNEIGAITLWVEYSIPGNVDASSADAGDTFDADTRIIHNVYSHRMQIKLEPVFNGIRVEE